MIVNQIAVHGRGPARVGRHRDSAGGDGTGYLVYSNSLPDHDGAARHRHRLAGDRDPAAALVVRRRGRPGRLGRTVGVDAAHARSPWCSRSRCCCRSSRSTSPTSLFGWDARRTAAAFAPTLALFGPALVVLHRPLPDAPRLLRPGADAAGLLHPVRGRRDQHRGRARCWSPAPTAGGHRAGAGGRLPGVVRRRRRSYLPRAAPHARRPARPRSWSGSWCGWPWSLAFAGAAARGGGAGPRTASASTRTAPVAAARRPERGGRRRWSSSSWPACCGCAEVTAVVDTVTRRRASRRGAEAPYDGLRQWDDGARTGEGSECRARCRPGDVLADRYRLVDLLTESGGGRFWRAHDRVLAPPRRRARHRRGRRARRRRCSRPRAAPATVLDRRLLRVLDADRPTGVCYVVNEWGPGDSLDILLAREGPLGPRRAAWLVSEVADAVAAAHEAGVAHGRLMPENVLIDHTARSGSSASPSTRPCTACPPGRVTADVDRPRRPALLRAHRQVGRASRRRRCRRRPERAAAGCCGRARSAPGSRASLDALCDEVLNPYAESAGRTRVRAHDRDLRREHSPTDLRATSSATPPAWRTPSRPPSPAAAQLGRRPRTVGRSRRRRPRRRAPTRGPDARRPPEPDPSPSPSPSPRRRPPSGPRSRRRRPGAVEHRPAHPGRDADLRRRERRRRLAPRARREARPAAAVRGAAPSGRSSHPSPPDGGPQPSTPAAARDQPDAGRDSTWPGGTEPRPGVRPAGSDTGSWSSAVDRHRRDTGAVRRRRTTRCPGRSWLRLAAVIAALPARCCVAVVVAYNLGRGRPPLGRSARTTRRPRPPPSAPTRRPSAVHRR